MDKELLEELCREYGFTYNEIGNFIRIFSQRDTWYILNLDYQGHKIELQHENTKGNTYMHSHGKHSNLENVFKCIYSHDNREMNRNNKTIKLGDMFSLLNQNIYKQMKSNV